MVNSVVLNAIAYFFQSFWQDAPGRIFISTVVAYFLSYIMYSGYLSWFAKGYGGILLSQIGFTVIDFLSLIPMVVFLVIRSIRPLLEIIAKYFGLHFLLPLILGTLIVTYFPHDIFTGKTRAIAIVFGFVLWFIGLALNLLIDASDTKYKKYAWFPTLISIVGFVMFLLAFSSMPRYASRDPSLVTPIQNQTDTSIISRITIELIFIIGIFFSIIAPFVVGMQLAFISVNEKLLSIISEINLKQPIPIPGAVRKSENLTMPEKKNCRLIFKSPVVQKPDIYTFVWDTDRPAYLVASFNRNTALYLPPETTQTERGQMLLIANDLIYSLGIQGPKSVNKE